MSIDRNGNIELEPYHENNYFAFVESYELLDVATINADDFPVENMIFRERVKRDLDYPNVAIWLDCIKAAYFKQLDWRDNPCEIDNNAHSIQRKNQLRELDSTQFTTILLLKYDDIPNHPNDFLLTPYVESSWQMISLNRDDGDPVITVPDFNSGPNLENIDLQYMRYERLLNDSEILSLNNVFNLNFIPNADFGEDERVTVQAPLDTSPSGTDSTNSLFFKSTF